MSDPTPKMQMILADPRTVTWRPPASHSQGTKPLTLQKMQLSELESAIGFKVRRILLPEAKHTGSALLLKHSTYYGDFSNGGHTVYEYAKTSQIVAVMQRQILRSDQPMMFMYGSNVSAFQRKIGSGEATVVIPLDSSPHLPFAECVVGDSYITIFFSWRASESDILRILQSLMA